MSLQASAASRTRAVDLLRSYLDDIDFAGFHKYLAGAALYYVNPTIINWRRQAEVAALDRYVAGPQRDLWLAVCLLADVPVRADALPERHAELAAALLAGELLVRRGDYLHMSGLQLVSVQGLPLLLDRRLSFGGEREIHDVYVGPDSALLSYYVDPDVIPPGARGLDLGTGTGVLGLYLARYCAHVTVTDIMAAPLWLAGMNRRLNRADDRVEVRRESYIDTLARGERYQVVSFNPPFLALPDEMDAPVYAKGIGADGLDYCRMLLELFDQVVAPGGVAYIVADLLGDADGPYFVADLERYAGLLGLCIDVFIDARVDLRQDGQHEALARGLGPGNPGLDPDHILARLRQVQLDQLRAACAFCTVMVARRAGPGGRFVHVFNRYAT